MPSSLRPTLRGVCVGGVHMHRILTTKINFKLVVGFSFNNKVVWHYVVCVCVCVLKLTLVWASECVCVGRRIEVFGQATSFLWCGSLTTKMLQTPWFFFVFFLSKINKLFATMRVCVCVETPTCASKRVWGSKNRSVQAANFLLMMRNVDHQNISN